VPIWAADIGKFDSERESKDPGIPLRKTANFDQLEYLKDSSFPDVALQPRNAAPKTLKETQGGWMPVITPVILASQEAEVRRTMIQGHLGNRSETQHDKGQAEWFKR
jgi:hypothetical protein